VHVRHYHVEAFMLLFCDRQEADRVLHTEPLVRTDLLLMFNRWW
jgi:hypothetical protein